MTAKHKALVFEGLYASCGIKNKQSIKLSDQRVIPFVEECSGLAGYFIIDKDEDYNSMDYIDYNLFLISDDRENGFKSTIINEKEEIIGKEKIWNFVSTSGNDDRKYEGTTVDDKKYYFNIKDNQIVDLIEVEKNIK